MTKPYDGTADGTAPEGFYRAKDVRLFPPMLTCFGKCRQVRARDLDPETEIFAFKLEPFGMGYVHIECIETEHMNHLLTKHERVKE